MRLNRYTRHDRLTVPLSAGWSPSPAVSSAMSAQDMLVSPTPIEELLPKNPIVAADYARLHLLAREDI